MPENPHQPDPSVTLDYPPHHGPATVDVSQLRLTTEDGDQTRPHLQGDPAWPSVPGYRITGEIAKGGMGKVYAALHLALDREVAIKTLLPGANAERFITESRITAKLPHPNIPPVHDLGTLSGGSPFLAMKLIRGQTLADLLKARPTPQHDLPRFVQVFEQIAHAVGFAHSRGVIHRDLKPLNVMVGEFGEVQVMDWGLAKDTASQPDEVGGAIDTDADSTRIGAILGTPGYMAPEQARGEPLDARADVFALGSILAAILTGKPAFSGTTAKDMVTSAAKADLTDVHARLEAGGVDSELLAVAKHCLAPERVSRPVDGRAVASEVAAYRAGVEARLRRAETEKAEALVREAEQRKRRRALTWAVGIIAAVLTTGLSASLWQMNRAINAEEATAAQLIKTRQAQAATATQLKLTEAARSDAVEKLAFSKRSNEILGSIFAGMDPKQNYETVGELRAALKANLEKAVQELDGSAIGDPLTVAAMQNKLGLSLLGLGDGEQAIVLLEKARDTFAAHLGSDHPHTIATMNNLAAGFSKAGRLDQALPLYEEALRRNKARIGPEHPEILTSMNNLAECYEQAGKLDRAMPLFEETVKLMKAKLGADHADTLGGMNNLAVCYQTAGKFQQALPLLEEALRLAKATLGPNHHDTLLIQHSLAGVYYQTGKLDLALPQFEKSLALMKSKLGVDHPRTLSTLHNLAMCYHATGKLDLALPLYEELFQVRKSKFGPNHAETLSSMNTLAEGYRTAERLDKALPLYEEALQSQKVQLGPDHPDTLTTMNNLALGYKSAGKLDLALPLYEESLKLHQAKFGSDHAHTLGCMNNLAVAYKTAGRLDQALPLYEQTLKHIKPKLGNDHPITLSCMNNLAKGYQAVGKLDQALPLFEETLTLFKSKFGPDHPDTLTVMGNIARAYVDAKQGDQAARRFQEFVAGMKKRLPPGHPQFAGLLAQVSFDLLKCDQFGPAEEMLRESLAIREKTQPDAWMTFNEQSALGAALLGQKKYADAEPLLIKGYEGLKARESAIPPQAAVSLPEALDRLIELYAATDQPDKRTKYQELRSKYPDLKKPGEQP